MIHESYFQTLIPPELRVLRFIVHASRIPTILLGLGGCPLHDSHIPFDEIHKFLIISIHFSPICEG
jgi:hypothetical protein